MGLGSLGVLGGMTTLLLLVCQWIGIFGLAKHGRDGPWRLMAGGAAVTSLGWIGTIGFFILSLAGEFLPHSTSSGFPSAVLGILIGGGGNSLGALLFGAGFAWHGAKSNRTAQRAQELESVIAAMDEELRRLRRTPPA